MKKWTLILLAIAALVPAQAQDFTAPVPGRRDIEEMPPAPAPRTGSRVVDVLQMFNPLAPREYGSGTEMVYSQESQTGTMTGADEYESRTHQEVKSHGFRLFSIALW